MTHNDFLPLADISDEARETEKSKEGQKFCQPQDPETKYFDKHSNIMWMCLNIIWMCQTILQPAAFSICSTSNWRVNSFLETLELGWCGGSWCVSPCPGSVTRVKHFLEPKHVKHWKCHTCETLEVSHVLNIGSVTRVKHLKCHTC